MAARIPGSFNLNKFIYILNRKLIALSSHPLPAEPGQAANPEGMAPPAFHQYHLMLLDGNNVGADALAREFVANLVRQGAPAADPAEPQAEPAPAADEQVDMNLRYTCHICFVAHEVSWNSSVLN